jgi:hypothetical protein
MNRCLPLFVLFVAASLIAPASSAPANHAMGVAADLQALDEQPLDDIARQGRAIIRLLRGSDHHWPGFVARIEIDSDHAVLRVKRFRSNVDPSRGYDFLGDRIISAQELTLLRNEIERIGFWSLPVEEDLEALAQREPPQQPQVVDGKTYEPNHPLTRVCMDGAVVGLEVSLSAKVHRAYRYCASEDIDPVLDRLFEVVSPILKRSR